MKKLISIVVLLVFYSSISRQTFGNDMTPYTWYKYQYGSRTPRFHGDSVISIPKDTTYTKQGIARLGSVFYVGNGEYWTKVSGTIGECEGGNDLAYMSFKHISTNSPRPYRDNGDSSILI